MNAKTYNEKVNWLFQQLPVFQKIGDIAFKPTLENARKIVDFYETPFHQLEYIHVAGTNGKGTTCSIVASYLTELGKKVGLFTSPHIKDFRERIRINGEMISEEEVVQYIEKIQKTPFDFSPSFFEATWGMALDYFYRQNCDVVVVETGLGGRLDATNIITPVITAITNIGLDHIHILGNTRKQIAQEKAGIIKQNVPVIIGESDKEIQSVFEKKAEKENAQLTFLPKNEKKTTFDTNKALAFELLRKYLHVDKLDTSLQQLSLSHLKKNSGWYGRLQVIQNHPTIIVDAAHNLEGVKRLIKDIQLQYPLKKVNAVYGASKDKDIEAILDVLPKEWNYFFTEYPGERSMKIEAYHQFSSIHQLQATFYSDAHAAYQAAKKQTDTGIIVVFGSFYLLEQIL